MMTEIPTAPFRKKRPRLLSCPRGSPAKAHLGKLKSARPGGMQECSWGWHFTFLPCIFPLHSPVSPPDFLLRPSPHWRPTQAQEPLGRPDVAEFHVNSHFPAILSSSLGQMYFLLSSEESEV